MGIARRMVLAAIVVLTLGWLPAAPAAAAASLVATVYDVQGPEHRLECGSAAGPCTLTYESRVYFIITVNFNSGAPITFNYVVEGITATAGVDYTVIPYPNQAGQVTVYPSPQGTSSALVIVKITDDGVAEPTETMRLRLTSSSRPVNISDTGLGTITNGSQLPPDCSLSRVSDDIGSLACTARPPAQQWRVKLECGGFPPGLAYGNTVTGNGTSTGRCLFREPYFVGPADFVVVA